MRARIYYALFIVAGAGFIWAILQLFEIRFSRGDVYPAYSTLRTDPLGAKAFYESLAHVEQLGVSRNETSLDRFAPPKGATLFFIGTSDLGALETEIAKLEHFVSNGGRLVITFYPQSKDTFLVERSHKTRASPSPSASPDDEPVVKFLSNRDVAKRWDLKFAADPKLTDSSAEFADPEAGSSKISWHSAVHFKDSGPVWKTICTSNELPVMLERSLGDGTIVLASDSYFLSNEAMRRERHADLLAWLIGPNRRVIFDETHLGISENPGISTLMRRYHLGGLLAGLLVLAVLVVWKNAARVLPSAETRAAADEVVLGKESFAGFVNLLRRNVAPPELLPLSVEQWSKRFPREMKPSVGEGGLPVGSQSNAQVERLKQIIKEQPRDIVGAYRQIAAAIHETKWNPHKAN
jgi:Domain of unknown function (DUF4350)